MVERCVYCPGFLPIPLISFDCTVGSSDSHAPHDYLETRPLRHLMRGRRVDLESDRGEQRSSLHQRADFDRNPQAGDRLG